MNLKCIIIDDEEYAIDALAGYINQINYLNLYAAYTNPVDAINSIRKEDEIDFIFLDIEMPELDGLSLAKLLRNKTKYLIFTTGHPNHAIEAFDLKVDHYLLKPISFAKFALTISEIVAEASFSTSQIQLKFIKGDSKSSYHYIDYNNIICIEAARNYVIIHTNQNAEQFITYMGLNHVEQSLDNTEFIRVNKSYIIAKKAIKKVDGNTIKLINEKIISIGITYKTKFNLFLNNNLMKK